MTYFAHTLPNHGPEHWEPLERHLKEVAELAGQFADAFGAKDWDELFKLSILVPSIRQGWVVVAFQAVLAAPDWARPLLQSYSPQAFQSAPSSGQNSAHETTPLSGQNGQQCWRNVRLSRIRMQIILGTDDFQLVVDSDLGYKKPIPAGSKQRGWADHPEQLSQDVPWVRSASLCHAGLGCQERSLLTANHRSKTNEQIDTCLLHSCGPQSELPKSGIRYQADQPSKLLRRARYGMATSHYIDLRPGCNGDKAFARFGRQAVCDGSRSRVGSVQSTKAGSGLAQLGCSLYDDHIRPRENNLAGCGQSLASRFLSSSEVFPIELPHLSA